VKPLRYQFICDNLTDKKSERLNVLLQEIENPTLNNGDIKNSPLSIANPFEMPDENLEKIKEIDEKLQNFKEMSKEKANDEIESLSLEKVNDSLYVKILLLKFIETLTKNLSVLGRDQVNLESKEQIEVL
jgi:hypothetical protein